VPSGTAGPSAAPVPASAGPAAACAAGTIEPAASNAASRARPASPLRREGPLIHTPRPAIARGEHMGCTRGMAMSRELAYHSHAVVTRTADAATWHHRAFPGPAGPAAEQLLAAARPGDHGAARRRPDRCRGHGRRGRSGHGRAAGGRPRRPGCGPRPDGVGLRPAVRGRPRLRIVPYPAGTAADNAVFAGVPGWGYGLCARMFQRFSWLKPLARRMAARARRHFLRYFTSQGIVVPARLSLAKVDSHRQRLGSHAGVYHCLRILGDVQDDKEQQAGEGTDEFPKPRGLPALSWLPRACCPARGRPPDCAW